MQYIITATSLNLRSGPSLNDAIICSLLNGQAVNVTNDRAIGCAEQSEAHLSRMMRFVPQHIHNSAPYGLMKIIYE